jgi:hypothetical protein
VQLASKPTACASHDYYFSCYVVHITIIVQLIL